MNRIGKQHMLTYRMDDIPRLSKILRELEIDRADLEPEDDVN